MKILLEAISNKAPDSHQQYLKRKRIGKGSEGDVYNCIEKSSGLNVAIKIIPPHTLNYHTKSQNLLPNKIVKLHHKNIIEIYRKIQIGKHIYIVMEMCDEDILSSIMNSYTGKYTEASSWRVFHQAVNGLIACHEQGIHHGDIKPENILLSGDTVKLADFHYDLDHHFKPQGREGVKAVSDKHSNLGSYEYLAPELLSCPGHPSSLPASALAAADVWALGLTLFVMAAGYKPWEVASDKDPGYKQFRLDAKSMWPTWFSEDLCSLLKGMLHHEASLRLSLLEVWEHSWVVNERWNEPRPPLEALRIDQQCVVEMGSEAGQANTPESCPCEDPHMSPRKRRKSSNS